MKLQSIVPALVVTICSTAAIAAPVPITVRVNGDPVQSIDLAGETGLVQLTKEGNGERFTGMIDINGSGSVVQPMVISYSDFRYPMNLMVHQYLKLITFPIEIKPASSCTRSRIEAVEREVTTLADAIANSMLATRLASIEGNDRCLGSLYMRAIRAKFRNARRMSQLSWGLFVVPEELVSEYRRAVPESRLAAAEVDRYETEAIELQGVQLVAARTEAQHDGDFIKAAAIQQDIAKEANATEHSRDAFENVGLSADRIAKDTEYLSNMATSMAAERDD